MCREKAALVRELKKEERQNILLSDQRHKQRALKDHKQAQVRDRALRLRKIELLKRTQDNLDARGLDTNLSTMVREFTSHFPDYVDNYKLTYPLADDLIKMNPRLHGIHPPKPMPH